MVDWLIVAIVLSNHDELCSQQIICFDKEKLIDTCEINKVFLFILPFSKKSMFLLFFCFFPSYRIISQNSLDARSRNIGAIRGFGLGQHILAILFRCPIMNSASVISLFFSCSAVAYLKVIDSHGLKSFDVLAISAESPERIMEIGPGKGAITSQLLNKTDHFIAIDADHDMVDYLHQNYPNNRDQIIQSDFLQVDLKQFFDQQAFLLCGNFPYNISSQK